MQNNTRTKPALWKRILFPIVMFLLKLCLTAWLIIKIIFILLKHLLRWISKPFVAAWRYFFPKPQVSCDLCGETNEEEVTFFPCCERNLHPSCHMRDTIASMMQGGILEIRIGGSDFMGGEEE